MSFKLRRSPHYKEATKPKYQFYPSGLKIPPIYGSLLSDGTEDLFVCEGEFDQMILENQGLFAITSTTGMASFKKEAIDQLDVAKTINICFDKSDKAYAHTQNLIKKISEQYPDKTIKIIVFPDFMEENEDITDFFVKYGKSLDDFLELTKQVSGKEKIDTSQFEQITLDEVAEIIGLTVKHDQENKLISFLNQLSAYTEDAQFNVSFNAPSSSGKSYIPTEVSRFFPEEDVLMLGYCSPTSLFHDLGEWDEEKSEKVIDLSRKNIIFLDQPHTKLIENLRPLLSHDKKEILIKITNNNKSGGNKTQNIKIIGFPTVTFCSAGLRIDEQESTRFFLLSPETSQEKLRAGIEEKLIKETDKKAYHAAILSAPKRKLLTKRIQAIKDEIINDVQIPQQKEIFTRFIEKRKILKPRHQRDIGRLLNIIKSIALLNVWFRERQNNNIIANDEDVEVAFRLWEPIAYIQELNIPPYIYEVYKDIILVAFEEKKDSEAPGFKAEILGVSRSDILRKYYNIYERPLPDWQLRQEIIPMLESAGLIEQVENINDRRNKLIVPLTYREKGEYEKEEPQKTLL